MDLPADSRAITEVVSSYALNKKKDQAKNQKFPPRISCMKSCPECLQTASEAQSWVVQPCALICWPSHLCAQVSVTRSPRPPHLWSPPALRCCPAPGLRPCSHLRGCVCVCFCLHSRPLETMVAPSAWLILAAPALFLYFNLSPDISTIPVTQQSFV